MSNEEIRTLFEVVDKFADGKTQLLDYEKRLKKQVWRQNDRNPKRERRQNASMNGE